MGPPTLPKANKQKKEKIKIICIGRKQLASLKDGGVLNITYNIFLTF